MNNPTNCPDVPSNYEYALTAIVLVYNGEPYLKDCINSLVNQTLDNLEILLINDVSTDDSLSTCQKFERKYNNVRLINKKVNGGLASSANLGISLAKGEYVILVDNDDIVPNYAYEKLYTRAKETDADICIGKANFIIGNSQFEFDYRENYVWRKEQIITDINKFPEIFEDVYYWNQVVKRDLLIKNNIKLPDGTVYADRYFTHHTYTYAKKIAIITDCVYLWRQVQSSLSHGRFEADNLTDRLDSFELDLDYLISSCDVYFKKLLKRYVIPVKGILENKEVEDIYFNRIRPFLKNQENKFDNLYDNDLNLIDNIYAYLIINNFKDELKKLLQIDLKEQQEIYEENGVSYWKLPLFRNPNVYIPDELFKIKRLINQFVTIDELNVNDDKIVFSNIKIPKYLPIKKLQIVFKGLTDYKNILADNTLTFDLNYDNYDLSYNIEISSEELANFELYDVFLKGTYENEKFNYVRLDDTIIQEINCNSSILKPYLTPIGNLSFITQNLNNQFKIDCDENKLKISMLNKENIKKNLKMLVRKDSTKELVYLTLNNEKNAFELEWKYFLDPRSSYLLFITIFNEENAKIRKNIRFKEKLLDDFNEKSLITDNNLNVKVYKTKNGDIRINSF